jgi:hypothetical protein
MPYIGNQPQYTSFLTDTFSGNGSTTVFTMAVAPANTAAVLVAIWGVLQDPTTYGIVGRILTFSQAPPTGVGNISVRYLALPASNVTTTAYRSVTEFTATAGQTTFTPASYTPGFIDVFRSGVRLSTSNYVATNGVTVVLNNAAAAGDLITIESFFVSSVLNAIPNVAGAITPTLLDSTSQSGSGAIQVPGGTTAQRPTSPSNGMVRFNTTLSVLEEFRDSQWRNLSSAFRAIGGVETTVTVGSLTYRVHTFTSSGAFTVVSGATTVEYLIAGGGGGGSDDVAGGGGAGGLLAGSVSVTTQAYSIIVGGGGARGTGTFGSSGAQATNGGNSSALFLTAIGGGNGAGRRDGSVLNVVAGSGGSGGGGAYPGTAGGSGTAGQGFAGGTAPGTSNGGGGGGAGSAGSGQTAGSGIASSISGSSITYAVGGGGGFLSGGGGTFSSTPGSGGRGGGNSPINSSGTGQDGIVIIRYII